VLDYVRHITDGEIPADAEESTASVLRFLFKKHADTYHISLLEAVEKWLPKFNAVYSNDCAKLEIVHGLRSAVELEEWSWEESWPQQSSPKRHGGY
jgi:hypothetical protein